jgi:hypothetical protein
MVFGERTLLTSVKMTIILENVIFVTLEEVKKHIVNLRHIGNRLLLLSFTGLMVQVGDQM